MVLVTLNHHYHRLTLLHSMANSYTAPLRPQSKTIPQTGPPAAPRKSTTNENTLIQQPSPGARQNRVHGPQARANPQATPTSRPVEPLQRNIVNLDIDSIEKQMQLLRDQLAQAKEHEENLFRERTRDDDNLAEKLAATQASLERALALNVELNERLQAVQASGANEHIDKDVEDKSITRPKGNAGQHFSIQVEMKLASSKSKMSIYKGIQRCLRELAIRSGMNWELAWADIPSEEKVKLYRTARKQHPYLSKFRNDWATEEIVKQFFKNKRKNHYRNGWLAVPERYAHMADVSSKRNPAGSRTKTARKVFDERQRKRDQQRHREEVAALEDDAHEDEEMADGEDNEDGGEDEGEAGNDGDIYA
ncbi:hypothetical protein D9619_007520 [Psilocybe cf. subviscida]|uniref:Uncharacterized protein n=1 Tax=Psilocybe cf. subviscida TaxID=2480587 RepID=A0A8H5B1N9_9AGAR|nr:hypothetical protein D9619_007520 [Psilocybe cf. subviscida]